MKCRLRSQSDRNRRRLTNEPLEARRMLAASVGWDGPGLGSAELTYTVGNAPSSLSQSEVDSAIETAFNAWASVADISFTEVNQTGLRDSIDISFKNIDGRGGILAQAYFPDDVNPARIAGDIEFDLAEVWEVGNSRGRQAFDLAWVAAHEIGHALGLDHSRDPGAVLAAYVSPNQQFVSLDDDDITEIRGLYAASSGTVTPSTPTQPTPAEQPTVTVPTNQVTPKESTDPTDNDNAGSNSNNNDSDDSNNDSFRHWQWRWRWRGFWRVWGGRATADAPANQNAVLPTDANDDGSTSSVDALVIVNDLNLNATGGTGFYDVNGDGTIGAAEALMVINSLRPERTAAESEQTDDSGGDQISEDGLDEQADVDDSVDDAESPTEDDDVGDANDDHPDRHHHRFGGRPLLRDFGQRLLTRFDSDESGSISEDEVPERLWQRLVDMNIDADGNGSIAAEEFEDYATERRAERFARKDSDESGSLTEDEVRPRFWNKIAEADANQDDGVTLIELEAWFTEQTTEEPESENAENIPTEGKQLAEDDGDQQDENNCDHNEMAGNDHAAEELRRFQQRSDRLFAQLGRSIERR